MLGASNKKVGAREKRQKLNRAKEEVGSSGVEAVHAERLEAYVPIHERAEDLVARKQEWIRQKKEELRRGEEERVEEAARKLSAVENDEFVRSQMSFLQKKNENLLELRIRQDKKLNESLTFKPKVNKKSEGILK